MCFLRLLYGCCCCCCCQQQEPQRVPLPDVQLQQLTPEYRRSTTQGVGLKQCQEQGQGETQAPCQDLGYTLQALPQHRITNSTLGSWSCGEEHYDADEQDDGDERLPTVWKAWWLQGSTLNEEILRNPASIIA